MFISFNLRILSLAILILNISFTLSSSTKHLKKTVRHSRHRFRRAQDQPGTPSIIPKNSTFTVEGLDKNIREYGPWGPWSDRSPCSRTCGGGVLSYTRRCNDRRRQSCVGPERKYESCNTQACPEGTESFRAVQCARFNTVPFEDKFYSWIPYNRAPNKCELNCMPKGERFYFRNAKKVIDGTPCYEDGRLDICVDGICLPVGCDRVLGSTSKEDKCRRCGGDGSSCKTVQGTFDLDNLKTGYNDILLIPAGATNIVVKELGPTNNYLAIRNLTGGYYLNGYWSIDFPRDRIIAGTLFKYERTPHGYRAPESLRALGPTKEPIFMALLYQERNPGIMYEYSIPEDLATTDHETYAWVYDQFGACSASCGGGYQLRSVSCTKAMNKQVVPDYLCDALLQPAINQSCNNQPCPAFWKEDEWSDCVVVNGNSFRFRNVICQQKHRGELYSIARDGDCERNMMQKPENWERCDGNFTVDVNETMPEMIGNVTKPEMMGNVTEPDMFGNVTEPDMIGNLTESANGTSPEEPDMTTYNWVVGLWGVCDKLCGKGLQSRLVVCQQVDEDNNTATVDDSLCDEMQQPENNMTCQVKLCQGVEWVSTEWSGCDACGLTMETRTTKCANKDGDIFPDETCAEWRKPELIRECNSTAECEYRWFASEWSNCSAECGNGFQTRFVFCGYSDNETVSITDDSECDEQAKYNDIQECMMEPCGALWYSAPWTRCSSPCGGGTRSREIMCLSENENNTDCDSNMKPEDMDSCNIFSCDGDEIMVVKGCKDSEHGCCPDGMTVAAANYEGCPEIQTNMTCNETEYGCCIDGHTAAFGPFRDGCPNITHCNETEYGCCKDGIHPATGEDFEGCTEHDCSESLFGCCPDGYTSSPSEDFIGCPGFSECDSSEYGCCPDGVTPAMGYNFTGCDNITCSESEFGCCSDNVTAANDTMLSNCDNVTSCMDSDFGCCPDGITTADDVDLSNCDNVTDCANTTFGCCPDGFTEALDEDYSNCENYTDCADSTYGCCPDGVTTADGPEFMGCMEDGSGDILCIDSYYGCCLDGITFAQGPNNTGCENITASNCSESFYGCCPNGFTEALGENFEGCNCSESFYGCCPNGIDEALGENFEGCNDTVIMVDSCENSTFGCCQDNVTAAIGPDFEGCENVTNCFDTEFKCCPDNRTAATGPDNEGCPCEVFEHGCCPDGVHYALGPRFLGCTCHYLEHGCCQDGYTPASGTNFTGCTCDKVLFSCCPDNQTPARGPHYEGCGCETMHYGCCQDGVTVARGINYEGCGCETTEFGCCHDQRTPARGPNFAGCDCRLSTYGCCPDGRTHANGPSYYGCDCRTFQHGCCPDGRTPAQGENYRGCDCSTTEYGCCPDGRTQSSGPNYQGCDCRTTQFGCCPDGRTSASGPNYEGCDCRTSTYGCCQDGYTHARGPNKEGCDCRILRFGCCPDGRTPAIGSGYEGCPCETGPFGCCVDGVTMASGPDYQGCPGTKPIKPGRVCGYPKDGGTCRDFKIHWFYNTKYGGCSRFWYGGCGGNENRFLTQQECEQVCIQPRGPDACELPLVKGTCDAGLSVWGFNYEIGRCVKFTYGGCLGNYNRFETQEECERTCKSESTIDPCNEPLNPGPCNGLNPRFYYNKDESLCEAFNYGGCEGNTNNFDTMETCEQTCAVTKPTAGGEKCFLPKEVGTCLDYQERWYYDSIERICKGFIYGGCRGNANNFLTKDSCESSCISFEPTERPIHFKTEYCFLDYEIGPCTDSAIYWYYNYNTGLCDRFYYSGCDGNQNRFHSRSECEQKCGNAQDLCELPVVIGSCSRQFMQWYYDAGSDSCIQFFYSGCRGNKNRFNSIEECQQRCLKRSTTTALPTTIITTELPFTTVTNVTTVVTVTPTEPPILTTKRPLSLEELCGLPEDRGTCSQVYEQFYYNSRAKKCEMFQYSGCGGNANRFVSLENCQNYCERNVVTNATTGNKDICRLAADKGPCDDQVDRWHYDVNAASCKQFVYGGCDGNRNRFKSEQLCARFCAGVKPQELCTNKNTECSKMRCPFGIEEYVDADGCNVCECYNPCRGVTCAAGERCVIEALRTREGDVQTTPICRLDVKPGQCQAVNDTSSTNCYRQCNTDADCRGNRKCCSSGCSNLCRDPFGTDQTTTTETPTVEGTKPTAEIINPTNVVQVGDTFTLNCQVSGNPQPNVVWFKDLEQIRDEPRYAQDGRGTLRLSNVQPSDAGLFTCLAYNQNGQARSEVTVSVSGDVVQTTAAPTSTPGNQTITTILPTGGPKGATIEPTDDKMDVKQGSPVTLRCKASGNPKPQIVWYKGNSIVDSDDDRYKVLVSGMLQISSVELKDADLYRCLAYNQHGQDDIAIRLNVEENVDVVIEKSPEPYHAGDRVKLDCKVTGYPKPRFGWYFNSQPLKPANDILMFANGTLILQNITANHTGIYTCLGANEISQKSSFVDIMIKGKTEDFPDCTDSPHFADCQRIVDGNFCNNVYYSRYCCRSCYNAGKIDPTNLNFES